MPTIFAIDDAKPKIDSIEDDKPKMESVDKMELQWHTRSISQLTPMGLLIAITYPEDQTFITTYNP